MSALTGRRCRARVFALVLLLGIACKNFESYVPHLVAIGGAVLQVAALNYVDPNYAPMINVLMGTLTPAAAGMATTWAQESKRQRELAALERIEQEIREEQAALEKARAGAADAVAGVVGKSVPPPEAGPLALDVALLRVRGDAAPVPLRDGDVLHDARGGEALADGLRVLVRPVQEAYVYVVAIDAVGRVQPLYPASFSAPSAAVPAGHVLLLPGPSDAYGLDEYRGVQHVFVYASEAPNNALEAQLARFARAPQPAPSGEKIYVVSEPTRIEAGLGAQVEARGLTNVRPLSSIALGGAGSGFEIESERATARPGESLIVTRWFEHR